MYASYVVDLETTGTDSSKHDVIEICLWRIGEESSKTWYLQPLNPETIEDSALRVNKHLREDILHQTDYGRATYKHPSVVLPEIEAWLMQDFSAAEERAFIGHNPNFDYDFMLSIWRKMGVEKEFPFGSWIPSHDGTEKNQGYIIDTLEMARVIDLCIGKKRDRYNLGSLVKNFGVTKAQAHRADGDVKMTKELFEKIIAVIKDPIIQAFGDCYGR